MTEPERQTNDALDSRRWYVASDDRLPSLQRGVGGSKSLAPIRRRTAEAVGARGRETVKGDIG